MWQILTVSHWCVETSSCMHGLRFVFALYCGVDSNSYCWVALSWLTCSTINPSADHWDYQPRSTGRSGRDCPTRELWRSRPLPTPRQSPSSWTHSAPDLVSIPFRSSVWDTPRTCSYILTTLHCMSWINKGRDFSLIHICKSTNNCWIKKACDLGFSLLPNIWAKYFECRYYCSHDSVNLFFLKSFHIEYYSLLSIVQYRVLYVLLHMLKTCNPLLCLYCNTPLSGLHCIIEG